MQRTTVMLPMDLKMRALRLAQKIGISLGEFIREAMEVQLRASRGKLQGEMVRDRLFTDDAVFSGPAPKDISKDHDRYLYGDKS